MELSPMNSLIRPCCLLVFGALTPLSAGDWQGAYMGASIGYGWADGKTTFQGRVNDVIDPENWSMQTTMVKAKADGGLVGIQAGYNWQKGEALYGLEGDIKLTGIEGKKKETFRFYSGVELPGGYYKTNVQTQWLCSLRARLGYAPSDRFLGYFTAGPAIGKMKYKLDTDFTEYNGFEWHYPAAFSKTKVGFAVGAGVEWMIGKSISARAEYMHYDLGNVEKVAEKKPGSPTAFDVKYSVHNRADIFQFGVNYCF